MEGSKSTSKAVVEFVKDLEGLKDADSLLRIGPVLANDEKLLASLMEFLFSEQCSEEQVLLERLYNQLLRCYRASDEHLMRFVSQFIFCLIWRHFSDLMKSRQYGIAIRPGLDALLVAIYSMAIVDSEGHPRVHTYTIPSLANSSLYHDPSEFTMHILRDNARSRRESQERRVIIGNYPAVERLTRGKKWIVFRVLMRNLSQDLPHHSKACQKSAIIMCRLLLPSSITRTDVELSVKRETKLSGLNFDRINFKSFSMGRDKTRASQSQHKIILDERFLLDSLDILYILAYQGLYEESLGLVLDLLEEGEYRILASVVLLGNAVKSRLESSKLEPDELDEVPPVNSGGIGEDGAPRKILVSNGSLREKRHKPQKEKKKVSESQLSKAEESYHEVSEVDNAEISRADTSSRAGTPMNELKDEPLLEAGEPVSPLWSPDISPQPFIKISPRGNNEMAETIV